MNKFFQKGNSTTIVIVVFLLIFVSAFLWKYKTTKIASQEDSQSSSQNQASGNDTVSSVTAPKTLSVRAEGTLAFSPKTLSTAVGQAFSLDAVVFPGKNKISGAELHVKYDPSKMKLVSVKPSTQFSLELQVAKIDNVKGEASIALGVPLNTPSASGSDQVVAIFSFLALGATPSGTVEFLTNSLLSADGETQNVLKTRESAQVTIAWGSPK
ncbi:MAG: cohesin domain-containing protein [Candidatus Moraniibacteriota bacterium]